MMSWLSSVVFGPSSWDRIKDGESSLTCELDVNGTIYGQETVQGKVTLPSVYANMMLANSICAEWVSGKGVKSYKAHVWDELHPGKNNDLDLRTTRKETLAQFVTSLTGSKHPLAERVSVLYKRLVSTLEVSSIFPGFPALIQTLQRNKVPHNFVFRTFGGDGEAIKDYLAKEFPDIELQEGSFDETGFFHYKKEGQEIVINTPLAFRECIKTGHWLIQDNFTRWSKGQERGNSGKLFVFSSDSKDLSLIADDNLKIVDSPDKKTIVCCYDLAKGEYVSTLDASPRTLEIDPVQAALDPNYLTSRVSKAVEKLLPPSQRKISFLKVAAVSTLLIAGILAYTLRRR